MRFSVLIVSLLTLAACETPPTPGDLSSPSAKQISIEFHLVHDLPRANSIERKVEATGETIYLASRPDLTEREIDWAEMQRDPLTSRPSVAVYFTRPGTDKLASLTRHNIGRALAIVIDGKVLSVPYISSEIPTGRVTIRGFQSAAEAQRVADSFARR